MLQLNANYNAWIYEELDFVFDYKAFKLVSLMDSIIFFFFFFGGGGSYFYVIKLTILP